MEVNLFRSNKRRLFFSLQTQWLLWLLKALCINQFIFLWKYYKKMEVKKTTFEVLNLRLGTRQNRVERWVTQDKDSHPEALVEMWVPFGESITKVLVLKVTATMIYDKKALSVVGREHYFSDVSLHPAKLCLNHYSLKHSWTSSVNMALI